MTRIRPPLHACAFAAAALVASLTATQAPAQSAATRLQFSLPGAASTSAGVYSSDGRLVRTLWRGETLDAGRHDRAWDQLDDLGRPVPPGDYDIRLVHHRIRHVWEGVVGNSSGVFTGAQVHKSFLMPTSIAVDGANAYYAVGYNEGQPGIHGFRLEAPGLNTQPLPQTVDPFVAHSMIAVDATRVYWANLGGLSKTTFVGAFERADGARVAFPEGQNICLVRRPNSAQCYEPQDYKGVIALHSDPLGAPTGLAVQRKGSVLAVAHGAKNQVRLFDKGSGRALGTIDVPLAPMASNQLAMSPGGALWVISGRTVLRFSALERKPVVTATISGLSQPIAVATHPDREDEVWIADGGASQQLKQFDSQGRPGTVIGKPAGLASDPSVGNDTLCFKAGGGREQSAIAVTSDRAVWVVDHCNNRMLRFRRDAAARWTADAQIAYVPASYASTVDHGNPRRVFANFLEFDVDGSVPLTPGDRSWRLVRNWLGGLPAALTDDRSINWAWGGFTSVQTLANGRTYGLMQTNGRQAIVELPATGPLRLVKWLASPVPRSTAKVLYENGELGYALTGPTTQTAMRLPLAGFDGNGDPSWSNDPVRQASVPTLPGSPFYRGAFSGMPPRFPVTASGNVVFFDQAVQGNEGFHLGAAATGGKEWLWQASPTGALDGKGSFQTKAIDGALNYGGNAVWAHGRHIVYGFHGEFYKDMGNGGVGQANQFMHFDESGLFIGQFGMPSTRATMPAQAGLAGNAFSPTLVRDGSKLYLYHNDESAHGGVHRWRIDGWEAVGELRGSGTTGSTIALR